MKQLVRTFSLGLLTATIIIAITYGYFQEFPSTERQVMSAKEMIEKLENQGYHVLNEDKYSLLTAAENSSKTNTEEKNSEAVTTYAVDIVSGSTSSDISEKLEKANIINRAEKFDRFMKSNKYSRYIQIGQVTLTSDMTYKEIAEAITSK